MAAILTIEHLPDLALSMKTRAWLYTVGRVLIELCFWLFKVDCEFNDLRVLRIGHTCVI